MADLTGWDLGSMIQGLRDAADSHKDQVAITRQRLVEAADALEAMSEESSRLRAMASANQGAIISSIIERTRTNESDEELHARVAYDYSPREVLLRDLYSLRGSTGRDAVSRAEVIDRAMAFVIGNPELQGEPSDAKVSAALGAFTGGDPGHGWSPVQKNRMRAALRAAREVTR